MTPRVVLASGSAIRRSLLEQAGLTFTVERPGVDEEALKASFAGTTEEMAAMLAEEKALNVSENVSHKPSGRVLDIVSNKPSDNASDNPLIIGSDSIAECRGRRFDKPANRDEAAEHLRFFSGKALSLVSAVVLVRAGIAEWSHVDRARLWVRPLSESFIETYLAAEWPDVGQCVGVFRLEGRGATFFERLEGSHFTVLGLPLLPLLGALRERGAMPS